LFFGYFVPPPPTVARFHPEPHSISIHARTKSPPPSNALHVTIPAADARYLYDDVGGDHFPRAHRRARVSFPERAEVRPKSRSCRATTSALQSLFELIL